MDKKCPRCGKNHFNTINVHRNGIIMPINKCIVCGFLWVFDEDIKELAKTDSKKMFINALRSIGK